MSSLRNSSFLATQTYLSAFDAYELKKLNIRSVIIDEVEKGMIEAVLHRCEFNQSWAADILGLSRNTLRSKAKKLGLTLRAHQTRRKKK
mgnify:CR=1 FL=1